MSIRVTQTKKGKRYAARVHLGDGKYKLLASRDTRKEAKDDEAQFRLSRRAPEKVQAKTFAKRYLAGYAETRKISSYDHAEAGIDHWLKTFGSRSLQSIGREESTDWASANRWAVPPVVTMLNAALDEGLVDRNEMRGQSRKSRGRADKDPLTVEDLERLASAAEEKHGAGMRAFVIFTAYTGMRVGEVFALKWGDVDFNRNRVMVRRRLYRGQMDLPKANKKREIVLLPEARDALLGLDRSSDWIFTAKRGGQITQTVLTYYWQKIVSAYGTDVTPHELRHFCAHHLYVRMGFPSRVVAAQLGHSSPRLVEMVYGHGDVGALDELEQGYGNNVRHLRAVND
jgi:integrase